MEDKIQTLRQPLVTATGIILGFLLNFATNFVKTESGLSDSIAYVIGICVLLGVISLILALARILNLQYSRDNAESYYQKTFYIFIFGVSISFTGVMIDMFSNFMMD